MTQRFNKMVQIILDNEGGDKITNRPNDPGGLTKYGICKKYHPNLDIVNLTEDQAKDVYLKEYYIPSGSDGIIDDQLALIVFDSAVNPGIGWTIKTIQKFVKVNQDGRIGSKTLEAINNYPDKKSLCALMKVARKEFYQNQVKDHPNLKENLKGWLRRVDELKYF